jgi:hypothetical protein
VEGHLMPLRNISGVAKWCSLENNISL